MKRYAQIAAVAAILAGLISLWAFVSGHHNSKQFEVSIIIAYVATIMSAVSGITAWIGRKAPGARKLVNILAGLFIAFLWLAGVAGVGLVAGK